MKQRVLHIVGGMDLGGTESMLMNLYEKMNTDVEFHFISYYDKEAYYDKKIELLGGKVIRLQNSNRSGPFRAIRNLYKIIKNEGPYDAVHAHTLFNCGIAMVAAKLGGVKVRITHAHANLELNSSLIRKIYCFFMRYAIRVFSTDFIACSNSAGKYLFGENIINNIRYKILPNYINYDKYLSCNDNNSIRKEFGIKDDDIVVGHVGRFVEAKNHDFLIDVLHKMISKNNKVKAILVGDGDLKTKIEERVKALGRENNIYFLGLRDDVEIILNNVDIFIFPSIYEGLGLVMIEAQCCGLPCLVSEAIQAEANLDIGLIKQVKLNEGVEHWCEEALKTVNKKNKDKKLIVKGIKNNGYELNNIVSKLLRIYKE